MREKKLFEFFFHRPLPLTHPPPYRSRSPLSHGLCTALLFQQRNCSELISLGNKKARSFEPVFRTRHAPGSSPGTTPALCAKQ